MLRHVHDLLTKLPEHQAREGPNHLQDKSEEKLHLHYANNKFLLKHVHDLVFELSEYRAQDYLKHYKKTHNKSRYMLRHSQAALASSSGCLKAINRQKQGKKHAKAEVNANRVGERETKYI